MSKLKQILDIVTANSEEAVDDLLELLNPADQTREELGQNFEDTIGYDPISYHDKAELQNIIDDRLSEEDVPYEVDEYLNSDAVNDAYEAFSDDRSKHLSDALDQVVYEHTGYSVDEEELDDPLDDYKEEDEYDD